MPPGSDVVGDQGPHGIFHSREHFRLLFFRGHSLFVFRNRKAAHQFVEAKGFTGGSGFRFGLVENLQQFFFLMGRPGSHGFQVCLLARKSGIRLYYGSEHEALLLGPHQWIFWTAVVGPYFVVQIIRAVKWKRSGGPWYVEPVPIMSGSATPPPGTYCEFSMMTWRNGVGNRHQSDAERRDSNG